MLLYMQNIQASDHHQDLRNKAVVSERCKDELVTYNAWLSMEINLVKVLINTLMSMKIRKIGIQMLNLIEGPFCAVFHSVHEYFCSRAAMLNEVVWNDEHPFGGKISVSNSP